MQRWILMGLAACVVGAVVLAGGAWFYRQNKPDSRWVPIPLKETSSISEREELRQHLTELLESPESLSAMVKDLDLQAKLGAATEEEAVAKLKSMMFIRIGEFKHPSTMMMYPTVDVGVEGKRKQQHLLSEIAVKLGENCRKKMGAPTQQ
jgi:hypothetical protein